MGYFRGRVSRSQFAIYLFSVFVAAIVVPALLSSVGAPLRQILVMIWTAVVFALSVSFSIRRFHDIGKTGWYTLGLFIPLLNVFATLVLLFARGDRDTNKYGPPIA